MSGNGVITIRDVVIDDEFRSYMPPHSDDERVKLMTNMLRAQKTGDSIPPVIVWKYHKTLLDGHTRLEIAKENDLPIALVEIDLPDREACIKYIIDAHIGRRNLTPERLSYFRGKQYEADKKKEGRPKKLDQSDPVSDATANSIAKQHGVSAPTIKRDAQFARAVDKLADEKGPEARREALDGSKPKAATVKEAFPKARPTESGDDFLRRAKTQFNSAIEEVSSLGRVLKELAGEDVGCYVNSTLIRRALGQIREALREAVPVDACPKCKGRRCILCKECGYVTAAEKE